MRLVQAKQNHNLWALCLASVRQKQKISDREIVFHVELRILAFVIEWTTFTKKCARVCCVCVGGADVSVLCMCGCGVWVWV